MLHNCYFIIVPIQQQVVGELEPQSDSIEHLVPPFRLTESGNGTNGFMLVGDSGETESLSHHLKVQRDLRGILNEICTCYVLIDIFQVRATLFDILSSSSSADHPLCDECTDSLLLLMDQQLRMTEGEWSDYNQYLKKLEIEQQYQGHEDVEMENLTKELQDVKAEEERMIRELEALRKEEIATKNAIVEQERERERLQSEEDRYWKEYSKHRRDLMLAEDECRR